MIIIALHGPMGSGKSTFSNELKEVFESHGRDVAILPFAKPLKDMASSIGWDGKKDEKGRKLLQLLGTEVCRNCISKSYWTDKWLNTAAMLDVDVVICDDLRFKSEYDMLADLAGHKVALCKIYGRGYNKGFWHWLRSTVGLLHSSEKQMPNYLFNWHLDNSRDMSKMRQYAEQLFQETK